MTDEEIVKVINTLIGNITPIADSYYDEKAKLNVQKLGCVIESLIYYLGNMTSEHYNSMYASEEDCGKEVFFTQAETEQYEEYYKDCGDCEAYYKEKHHCPKFCKVITEVVKEKENKYVK